LQEGQKSANIHARLAGTAVAKAPLAMAKNASTGQLT
jgi:hypothetical protein